MISRYGIFCKVIELASFSKVARKIGYSQSAVSQTIKSLEKELGVILIDRKKDGITLTSDGKEFLPYLEAIYSAECALEQKHKEITGLENSIIRLGTFTSVSRNILPQLMKQFKKIYPNVNFILKQGEYTSIQKWVQTNSVDFGFVNSNAVSGIDVEVLYEDEMLAVLPPNHPLAQNEMISLAQLAKEPFILLDEGDYSVIMNAFQKLNLSPQIEYEVYDDYSILAMVRQGLGVSAMYGLVLNGLEKGLQIRPIREKPTRPVALAWQNKNTMSLASRRFMEFIQKFFAQK
ncbi:LysR family transcriptional regulator [Megamonas hypermegale]|uniref:LysR family transcriptional regulator n=1 Tax=Megamonas hypermegale TaxID=158847 RepID=UPI0025A4AE51|nr:LysR family transcriptional regulator [Megamonas hypermegale]MDM8143829.1 LysR family transcriptional regulator [Megamonas hypermegale]